MQCRCRLFAIFFVENLFVAAAGGGGVDDGKVKEGKIQTFYIE